jgi:hypothetical protein
LKRFLTAKSAEIAKKRLGKWISGFFAFFAVKILLRMDGIRMVVPASLSPRSFY